MDDARDKVGEFGNLGMDETNGEEEKKTKGGTLALNFLTCAANARATTSAKTQRRSMTVWSTEICGEREREREFAAASSAHRSKVRKSFL